MSPGQKINIFHFSYSTIESIDSPHPFLQLYFYFFPLFRGNLKLRIRHNHRIECPIWLCNVSHGLFVGQQRYSSLLNEVALPDRLTECIFISIYEVEHTQHDHLISKIWIWMSPKPEGNNILLLVSNWFTWCWVDKSILNGDRSQMNGVMPQDKMQI